MDALKFTTIAHRELAVCNPLAEEVLDDALAVLAQRLPAGGARVLDVGCGKAELLLRLAERYGVDGVGVDINPAFIAEARSQAAERLPHGPHDAGTNGARRHPPHRVRPHEPLPGVDFDGLPGRVTLHAETFADFLARRGPDGETFDAVLCIGASHAVGTPRETPARLAQLLAPGGALLLGEGYWRSEPAPEYLGLLGAARDQFTDHAGNRELGAEAGLTCVHAVETSPEDFERYELRYARAIDDFVRSHPGDPDAPAMARRIDTWQAGYRRWGRQTLGFGLYLFVAP
jgi:SAM-dependent methyltransferase